MASNPGHIPAGGKEKISVTVDTANRGGSFVRKSFLVQTNDPKLPQSNLTISGQVRSFINVSPAFVRLMGSNQEDLTQIIEIKPRKEYPFAIKKVTATQGQNIRFDLKPVSDKPVKDGYRLFVTNTRQQDGYYRDFIVIETDLKQKPTLRIPVSGRIFAQQGADATINSGSKKN